VARLRRSVPRAVLPREVNINNRTIEKIHRRRDLGRGSGRAILGQTLGTADKRAGWYRLSGQAPCLERRIRGRRQSLWVQERRLPWRSNMSNKLLGIGITSVSAERFNFSSTVLRIDVWS